jgi:hypothetical protein
MPTSKRHSVKARARDLVVWAYEEAALRGDRRLGTDHLFLAVLHDPDAARALGTDLDAARGVLDSLDRAALGSVGLHLDALPAPVPARGNRRPPLTSGARTALTRASKHSHHRIAPDDLLFALLTCRHPDPAAELMATLHVDTSALRDRLGSADDA